MPADETVSCNVCPVAIPEISAQTQGFDYWQPIHCGLAQLILINRYAILTNYFLKDEIILHHNSMFFALKNSNIGLPRENAHQITNDQNECMRVKKTKKGKFRDKIE